MGNAGAVEVAFVVNKYLCLVDQAAEGVGVDDAIAIPLELGAEGRPGFRVAAAARCRIVSSVRGENVGVGDRRIGIERCADAGDSNARSGRSGGRIARCWLTRGGGSDCRRLRIVNFLVHEIIRSNYSTSAAAPARDSRRCRRTRKYGGEG